MTRCVDPTSIKLLVKQEGQQKYTLKGNRLYNRNNPGLMIENYNKYQKHMEILFDKP